MNKLSLKGKLGGAFGLILLIMTLLGGYAYLSMQTMNSKTNEITDNWLPGIMLSTGMNDAMADYRQAMYRHVMTPKLIDKEKYEKQMQAADAVFRKDAQEYQRLIEDASYNNATERQKDLDSIAAILSQWDQVLQPQARLTAFSRAGDDQARLGMKDEIDPAMDKLDQELLAPLAQFNQEGAMHLKAESIAQYNRSIWILTVVIVAALTLGIVVVVVILRGIMGTLRELMHISTKVASGDLQEKAAVRSGDELGKLTVSYNQMIDNIKALIRQIQKTSEQVAASSQELTASAEQSAEVTQNIAKSITDVSELSTTQVDAVNASTQVIEKISAGIEETAATIHLTAEQTKNAVEVAASGNETIERAVGQMASIERTVNESAAVVTKLGERSKEIGQIVDTISGIAGQTNLLALNAAIEAARVGDMGKGFAVVAEEVRKLAEQSQEAAKQIGALIAEVQGDTEQAVLAMESGTKEVKRGAAVVNEAGEAFEKLRGTVDTVNGQANDVARTMEELAKGAQEIVGSVQKIDQSTKNVAAEAQSVSAATEEQSASMEEIAASSRSLSGLAQELQSASGRFSI